MDELIEKVSYEIENMDIEKYLSIFKKNGISIDDLDESHLKQLPVSIKVELLKVMSPTFFQNKENVTFLQKMKEKSPSNYEMLSTFIDSNLLNLVDENAILQYKEKYGYGSNFPDSIFTDKRFIQLFSLSFQEENEYLNQLKKYSKDQILLFLNLALENPEIVDSSYDMWFDQKFSSYFLKIFKKEEKEKYEEIYKENLVEVFLKYKDLLKPELTIDDLKRIRKIMEYHMSLEKEIVTSYIENTQYRDFIKREFSLLDVELLSYLHEKIANDPLKIEKMYSIVSNRSWLFRSCLYQPSKEEFIEQLLNYPAYFAFVFKNLESGSPIINREPNGEVEELIFKIHFSYCHEDPLKIKAFLFHTFPFLKEFLSLDYGKIKDEEAKYFYETLKRIMESNNGPFLKNAVEKLNKHFSYKTMYHTIGKSILDFSLEGKNKTDFKEKKATEENGFKFYHLTGEDFTLFVHCIDPNFKGQNDTYMKAMLSSPSMFADSKADFNHNLSLSAISEKRNALFGLPLVSNREGVRLGFSSIPSSQVLGIHSIDGGTNVKQQANSSASTFYSLENTLSDVISTPESIYNEVLVTRFLPNQEKRKPDYILITEKELPNFQNSLASQFATYFQIPVVVIHVKEYEERFKKEFEEISLASLPVSLKYQKLCFTNDLITSWSGNYQREYFYKIYACIMSMASSLNQEMASVLLKTISFQTSTHESYIDLLLKNLDPDACTSLLAIKNQCEELLNINDKQEESSSFKR